MATRVPEGSALVLSEIFPPAIGGSGELLRNVYVRFRDVPVTVVADRIDGVPARSHDANVAVLRRPMRTPAWGVLTPVGVSHHVREAWCVRRMAGRPTVVHVARVLPEGVGAWLASRARGPRYVCWAHGEDVASAGTSRELTLLMTRVFARASAVLTNSRNTAAMVERAGVPRTQIVVVHPGVDADRFAAVDRARVAALRARLRREGECLLLTVGRLQRRKGHDLMLRAVSSLRDAGRAVRYVIVGDGEERSRLEALAVELGVADVTHFEGVVAAGDLPVYYAAADVFCHPNRVDGHDVEGFGIVFLEAAAAGLPVIGGDSGGVPEAVERDVTGLLVSGTDVDELASALVQLLDQPHLRQTLGDAGRARVRRDFTWDRAARAVEAVHRRIAEEP